MRQKGIILSFIFVLLGFGIWNTIKPEEEISYSERRNLRQMPVFSWGNIIDGSFSEEFESYIQDQFAMREQFRRCKSFFERCIFRKADVNGIYVADGQAAHLEYPLDESSIECASQKFGKIYSQYLKNTDCRVFGAVVPDKNFYLAETNGYPSMDYAKLIREIQEQNPFMEYIDLTKNLTIDDYYKTDVHWKQECLIDVAETLMSKMGTDMDVFQYDRVMVREDFYGVYEGQSALLLQPDTLFYLDSEVLQKCKVTHYEKGKREVLYDLDLAKGKDPYEMFLSGSISFMMIENPEGNTGKELILFRDSFGSSLAPLFMAGYDKVTLVDIRYLSTGQLEKYLTFQGQDVLFLYSTLVLNNSRTLK